jgi:hypothetical protein
MKKLHPGRARTKICSCAASLVIIAARQRRSRRGVAKSTTTWLLNRTSDAKSHNVRGLDEESTPSRPAPGASALFSARRVRQWNVAKETWIVTRAARRRKHEAGKKGGGLLRNYCSCLLGRKPSRITIHQLFCTGQVNLISSATALRTRPVSGPESDVENSEISLSVG